MVKRFFTAIVADNKCRVFFADLKVIIKRRRKDLPFIPEFKAKQIQHNDDKMLLNSSDEN